MSPPPIAIIAPGAMGSGVAKRLLATTPNLTILTDLSGRSLATRKRALEAGMEDASLEEIVRRAKWVLSILPPSEAEAFAKKFKETWETAKEGKSGVNGEGGVGGSVVFADCNAVNPTTVKRIASILQPGSSYANGPGAAVTTNTAGTIGFVDAGIIGGPPSLKPDGSWYDPVFYATVDPQNQPVLDEFLKLKEYGLNVSPLRGEGAGVGDASALKMSYAGIAKGTTGLFVTMILAAHASSPATAQALLHELASSQPQFLKRLTTSIPDMLPKAYRWVGEMEEISQFVSDGIGAAGDSALKDGTGGDATTEGARPGVGAGKIHEGMARLYERIEKSVKEGEQGGEDVRVLKKFVQDAKDVIQHSNANGVNGK